MAKRSCRYTYEGGRTIHRDGKPFFTIHRDGGTPVEVDDVSKRIVRLLCGGRKRRKK